MATGTIARIVRDKGFGFVREGGRDLFFHRSCCVQIFDDLQEGETVLFEEEESQKGPRATHVTRPR
jgi:CspA family cold shock protein